MRGRRRWIGKAEGRKEEGEGMRGRKGRRRKTGKM